MSTIAATGEAQAAAAGDADHLIRLQADRREHYRLVIPSMNVVSGRVHLWKTAHNERFVQDYLLPMVDAAMATSAAPPFFRPKLTAAGTR